MYTADWLLYFGLVFIFFILVTPSGLTGVGMRLFRLIVPEKITSAAMGNRVMPADPNFFPEFLAATGDEVLHCLGISKGFGGIRAVNAVEPNVTGERVTY